MNIILRVLLSVTLGFLCCFSIYGFLSTFEPINPSEQIAWRAVYVLSTTLSIVGITKLNK